MALAGVAGAGFWWIGARTQELMHRTYDVPLEAIVVPASADDRLEGERLAWLRGCHGCHADSLQGKVFLDEPRVMRLVAPNVTQAIRNYSDAELARLIRHGVTRAGRAAFGMPSASFYHLSDLDLGRIMAHLRAAPVQDAVWPATELRLMARIAMVRGEFPSDAGSMDHRAARLGDSADTSIVSRGRYLAMTICSECHGMDLRGQDGAPGLMVTLGYDLPAFRSLMLDGRSRDGRDLGLMAVTARRRFTRLRAVEIDALWTFLRAMPLGGAP
jgi:cytochrome c553